MMRWITLPAFSLMLVLSACSIQHDQVLVVRETRTYHTDECPRVKMAHTVLMTRDDARRDNCKPCPGCRPDDQ